MRIGTSHFVNRAAAIRYYRPYEGDDAPAAVNRKLIAGEIHIGPPALRPGETCRPDVDGRYIVDRKGP